MKNDTVCKEKASNVFLKEREQYFEIQDLKAKLQDKNIAISELKKLIEKNKGKDDSDMKERVIEPSDECTTLPIHSVLSNDTSLHWSAPSLRVLKPKPHLIETFRVILKIHVKMEILHGATSKQVLVIQKKVIREKDIIDLEADIPKKSASGKDVQCCSCHQNNNDEVQAIVDRSAYQLCDKYANVDNNDQLPTEITTLIGKKYAFKVFIDDYNLKKLLPVFTMLRLSDDPEILDSIRLAITPIKVLDKWTFTARLINGHDYCYSNLSNLVI
ncbi:hypothetical protein Tco_0572968 [Tanacetum coccineum]